VSTFWSSSQDVYPFTGDDLSRFEFFDFRVSVVAPGVVFTVGFDSGRPVIDREEFDISLEVFTSEGEPCADPASSAEEVDSADGLISTTTITVHWYEKTSSFGRDPEQS
jgi:hypothetical protein